MSADDLDRTLANAPPPAAPPMSAELAALMGDLKPVPMRRPLRQLALLTGASLVYGAILLPIVRVRRDLGDIGIGWIVGVGALWLAGFVTALYLATVPARGAIVPRWRAGGIVAAITALGFVAFGLLADIPSGAGSDQFGWPRFAHGHTCLEIGLACALCPAAIGALFLRGALPVGARWAAAALGAAGGCLGGLVLHLHCYITDNLHIGLVHGGVVVLAAGLAAWIVPRATVPR